jgi:hypothetical protein
MAFGRGQQALGCAPRMNRAALRKACSAGWPRHRGCAGSWASPSGCPRTCSIRWPPGPVCKPRRPALLRARSMRACECLGLCGRFCRAAASYPLRHDGDNKSDSGAAVADCALPVGQRLPAQNRRPRCWQRSRAGFRAVAPRRSRRQGVVSRHQACALAKRASRQAMASRMPRSRATSMKARLSGEPCDSIVWSMSSAMRSAVGMPWIS